MKKPASKTAAASASGKPGTKNSKPAKGAAAKAAKNAAAGAAKGTPAADAAASTGTPPAGEGTEAASAGATTAASATGTPETAGTPAPGTEAGTGATGAPSTAVDFKANNPDTGKPWTVKEMRAEMAKNAAIIQSGNKPPQGVIVEEPVKPVVLSTRPIPEITKDWIVETPGEGLGFQVKEGMPVEEWAALVRSLDRQHENIGFAIGDLLNYGAKAYGKTYDEALKATGRSIKTLRNWKNIAASIAPEVRKVDLLSFGIHEAVASLPAPKQAEILEKAVKAKQEGNEMSVRDVRKLAKAAKPAPKKRKQAPTPPPTSPGAGGKKVPMTEAEEKQWEKAQEALDKAATFVRGKIWQEKLTKVDKNSVKSVLKMLADAYQEVVNG